MDRYFRVGFMVIAGMVLASCGVPMAPEPAPVPMMDVENDGVASPSTVERSEVPKNRPGLGTGWGEEVNSEIRYTGFRRASEKAAGVAVIYYNDKEGVDAMAQSRKYDAAGMQEAAGGLVSWGVKSGWGMAKNINSGGKRYVIGRKNGNYSLQIKNLCASRLEVVLSVDGLDVMDGKTATIKKRGYIIDPAKTLEVSGFRTSEEAVAAFRFSSVAGSYANQRHGATRNVGVIGMAVFTEKGRDPWKWSRKEINERAGARAFAEAPAIGVRGE